MISPRTITLSFDRDKLASDDLARGDARWKTRVTVATILKANGTALGDSWKTDLKTVRMEIKRAAWPATTALAALELDETQIMAAPDAGPSFAFRAAHLNLDLGENRNAKFWLVLWGTDAAGEVVDFGEAWLVLHQSNASAPGTVVLVPLELAQGGDLELAQGGDLELTELADPTSED